MDLPPQPVPGMGRALLSPSKTKRQVLQTQTGPQSFQCLFYRLHLGLCNTRLCTLPTSFPPPRQPRNSRRKLHGEASPLGFPHSPLQLSATLSFPALPPFPCTPDLYPVTPNRAPNSDSRTKNQAAPLKDFLKDKDKVEGRWGVGGREERELPEHEV